ncbi:hypothetical protein [Ralstonia pseudosolanacearum]|uniref:hypothetical protein n=1 Tax=Ralstonia pseudosolanacearum TaxID=1310165 RepID=UPI0038656CB1
MSGTDIPRENEVMLSREDACRIAEVLCALAEEGAISRLREAREELTRELAALRAMTA